ncbi:hypothetical protein B0H21DRAFT_709804 [Amylocystis lapponica]|nr:hypothetical protein B0H21DRAFT_709804 [Amylocystis lapponica]
MADTLFAVQGSPIHTNSNIPTTPVSASSVKAPLGSKAGSALATTGQENVSSMHSGADGQVRDTERLVSDGEISEDHNGDDDVHKDPRDLDANPQPCKKACQSRSARTLDEERQANIKITYNHFRLILCTQNPWPSTEQTDIMALKCGAMHPEAHLFVRGWNHTEHIFEPPSTIVHTPVNPPFTLVLAANLHQRHYHPPHTLHPLSNSVICPANAHTQSPTLWNVLAPHRHAERMFALCIQSSSAPTFSVPPTASDAKTLHSDALYPQHLIPKPIQTYHPTSIMKAVWAACPECAIRP